MPITYWKKTGVEVASRNTFLADLGSLSLEFTRLSQLTGEPKFYDAVQHITHLPGRWPMAINTRQLELSDMLTVLAGSRKFSWAGPRWLGGLRRQGGLRLQGGLRQQGGPSVHI
jgi:hypothetical protein